MIKLVKSAVELNRFDLNSPSLKALLDLPVGLFMEKHKRQVVLSFVHSKFGTFNGKIHKRIFAKKI